MHKVNMVGEKHGRLTVIAQNPQRLRGQLTWDCVCDCGERILAVKGGDLRSGNTKSCGCLRREMGAALGGASRKHGESLHNRSGRGSTPEYSAWANMKSRCQNPNHRSYGDYGGRGITVCERWQSFESFIADMGRRPNDFHSLDRIDNNGNYEPGNVRWATSQQQNANQRARGEGWKATSKH